MGFNNKSGDEGIRTPDPLRARQVLSQLSYTPKEHFHSTKVVDRAGLEPATSRLSGVRSNQLSYRSVRPIYNSLMSIPCQEK